MEDGIYFGQIKDSKRHGEGEFKFNDGRIYKGTWLNDLQNGKGEMISADKSNYIGDWNNGKQTGYGEYKGLSITYKGYWKDD